MYINRLLEVQELLSNPNLTSQQIVAYLNGIYQDPLDAVNSASRVTINQVATNLVFTQLSTPLSLGLVILGQGNGVITENDYSIASDSDGIVCALTVAARLLELKRDGYNFQHKITVATHVRTAGQDMTLDDSVDAQISYQQLRGILGFQAVFAVRSVKDNLRTSFRGFCLTPTIKEGWILPMSGDLFRLAAETSGEVPQMLPVTMYDIMRGYNNASPRANNLLTPNIWTDKPVVGIGIAAQTRPPAYRTNASHFADIEETARFITEAALAYDKGELSLYDADMFARAKRRYSAIDMSVLQKISI